MTDTVTSRNIDLSSWDTLYVPIFGHIIGALPWCVTVFPTGEFLSPVQFLIKESDGSPCCIIHNCYQQESQHEVSLLVALELTELCCIAIDVDSNAHFTSAMKRFN
jgi:hypothetical protein